MSSLHDVFQELMSNWMTSGAGPAQPVEGAAPVLATALGAHVHDFTFDGFFHTATNPEWAWQQLAFDDVFDGYFLFYIPTGWSDIAQKDTRATFGDPDRTRQSVFLAPKDQWISSMRQFLANTQVTAFAYYPLHPPYYDQWVFVAASDATQPMWAYGVYSSGDWVVVVKGHAAIAAELSEQLTSLVNTNPWYGWITAAKAQRN